MAPTVTNEKLKARGELILKLRTMLGMSRSDGILARYDQAPLAAMEHGKASMPEEDVSFIYEQLKHAAAQRVPERFAAENDELHSLAAIAGLSLKPVLPKKAIVSEADQMPIKSFSMIPAIVTFGEGLSKLRESRGMSQQELAGAIGVSRKTIFRCESDGGVQPRKEHLQKILDFFQCDSKEQVIARAQEYAAISPEEICDTHMALRTAEKLSQREFALKVGCQKTAISGYETGIRHPGLHFTSRIAHAHGFETPEEMVLAVRRYKAEGKPLSLLVANLSGSGRGSSETTSLGGSFLDRENARKRSYVKESR